MARSIASASCAAATDGKVGAERSAIHASSARASASAEQGSPPPPAPADSAARQRPGPRSGGDRGGEGRAEGTVTKDADCGRNRRRAPVRVPKVLPVVCMYPNATFGGLDRLRGRDPRRNIIAGGEGGIANLCLLVSGMDGGR